MGEHGWGGARYGSSMAQRCTGCQVREEWQMHKARAFLGQPRVLLPEVILARLDAGKLDEVTKRLVCAKPLAQGLAHLEADSDGLRTASIARSQQCFSL